MSNFETYSLYYDLLNKEKNYRDEVDYIRGLISKHSTNTRTILELGCGTGNHALLLQQKGFHVTGIDRSSHMLQVARKKLNGSDLKFVEGDVRTFNNGRLYDGVISLFHVMSYMTEVKALNEAFHTAQTHLNKKGLFIFDCWHGPTVLNETPSSRIKTFETEKITIKRTSCPDWIKEKNLVNVNFEIHLTEKETGAEETIKEIHPVRYWFENEIEEALNNNGFELLRSEEWLTGRELTNKSWNACYIAKKLN